MRADTPDDQTARIEELNSFSVLDTEPEENFDEIVDLVKTLCDVPMAIISFVDEDRQWFKARSGIETPQMPIDNAICGHTILQDELLEIPDTLADPRTKANTICLDPDMPIRFYAGAPLVTRNGFRLGSLCVLDTKPRTLTPLQRQTLATLARQVMRQLDLRRALQNEAVLRKEIDHRVKNSLQAVSSFIRLYSSRARHDETREALSAISRRVTAISQLHSELYRTSEFDMIRLDQYLGRVCDLMKSSLRPNVTLQTHFAPVRVDSRKAATIAMIVSEFAANSDKHAFPDGRSGVVRITVERDAEDAIHLICSDNGIGDQAARMPTADSEMASIGMRLMESAAEQIGGQITMEAGTEGYTLRLVTDPGAAEAGPRAVVFSAE